MRVLILTKSRLDYDGNIIGLSNSAKFLDEALNSIGVETVSLRVTDGNSIDRELNIFRPNLVILEALWVTPAKITELSLKYPSIGFIVRIHSNIPFLSMEGTAIKQIREISNIDGVLVAANNKQTALELRDVFDLEIPFLPNIYLKPSYTPKREKSPRDNDSILDISCFGAIRPMKNQLIQALAAIHAADRLDKRLHYHINSTRVEQRGEPILHNIEAAFDNTDHKLIEHSWEDHPSFLNTISKIDLGLQMSFSESFNIVAADHVHVGVPVVVSHQIDWLPSEAMADANSMFSISNRIVEVLNSKASNLQNNTFAINNYNNNGLVAWNSFLTKY